MAQQNGLRQIGPMLKFEYFIYFTFYLFELFLIELYKSYANNQVCIDLDLNLSNQCGNLIVRVQLSEKFIVFYDIYFDSTNSNESNDILFII